jgi:hypothetical protein
MIPLLGNYHSLTGKLQFPYWEKIEPQEAKGPLDEETKKTKYIR